jgi:hypothetical protein
VAARATDSWSITDTRGLRSVVPLRQSGRAAAAWLLAVSLVTDEV